MEPPERDTLVVNLYGGPGVGKTSLAHRLMAELMGKGYVCEYVPEYAKELVWELNSPYATAAARSAAARCLDGSVWSQRRIWEEQSSRVNRLMGQCDVVICDSPTPLSLVYLSIDSCAGTDYERLRADIMSDYRQHDNFDVLIRRPNIPYETTGRIQSAGDARATDELVTDLLDREGIQRISYLKGHTEAKLLARLRERRQAKRHDDPTTKGEQCLTGRTTR